MTEDKMIGWYHGLNGHEIEQAPEDGEGQGSLACYSPWVTKSRTKQHSFSVFWRLVSEPLLS